MADLVTCSKCGSVYEREYRTRLPAKDRDSYECDVCGQTIDRWNSTSIPSFKLVERREKPE